MNTVFILTFCIGAAQALVLTPFSCSDGAPNGVFCKNDLSGYVNCNLVNGHPSNKVTQCPKNTRCSCFINTPCSEGNSYICEKSPPTPKLSETFDIVFTEQKVTATSVGQLRTNEKVRVIRNFQTKQLAIRIWDIMNDKQRFEVIVPSDDHFVKYHGVYPDGKKNAASCSKTIIKEFPEFWPDFELFTLVKSYKDIERWVKKIGSRNGGQSSLDNTWMFSYNQLLRQYIPKSEIINFEGSQAQRSSSVTKRSVEQFNAVALTGAYFWPPGFC